MQKVATMLQDSIKTRYVIMMMVMMMMVMMVMLMILIQSRWRDSRWGGVDWPPSHHSFWHAISHSCPKQRWKNKRINVVPSRGSMPRVGKTWVGVRLMAVLAQYKKGRRKRNEHERVVVVALPWSIIKEQKLESNNTDDETSPATTTTTITRSLTTSHTY